MIRTVTQLLGMRAKTDTNTDVVIWRHLFPSLPPFYRRQHFNCITHSLEYAIRITRASPPRATHRRL